jgi:hypothetical protein
MDIPDRSDALNVGCQHARHGGIVGCYACNLIPCVLYGAKRDYRLSGEDFVANSHKLFL